MKRGYKDFEKRLKGILETKRKPQNINLPSIKDRLLSMKRQG